MQATIDVTLPRVHLTLSLVIKGHEPINTSSHA
jgi:hypothetical protein